MSRLTQIEKISEEKAYLEVRSKSELLANPNEPLGGVVLVPLDCIPVVHRELMVEVVVAFPNGDECGNQVIARSVLVVERRFAQPVSK